MHRSAIKISANVDSLLDKISSKPLSMSKLTNFIKIAEFGPLFGLNVGQILTKSEEKQVLPEFRVSAQKMDNNMEM